MEQTTKSKPKKAPPNDDEKPKLKVAMVWRVKKGCAFVSELGHTIPQYMKVAPTEDELKHQKHMLERRPADWRPPPSDEIE